MMMSEKQGFQRDVARKHLSCNKDVEGLEVKRVSKLIGEGLFATKRFTPGEFLCEYAGELVTAKEGKRRELRYPIRLGSFLFFFKWKGQSLCIDATLKKDRICRFANDANDIRQNSVMLLDILNDTPHLCLYATKEILPGDEVRYDYGVKNLPWRVGINSQRKQNKNDKQKNPSQCSVVRTDTARTTRSKSSGKQRKYYTKFRRLNVFSPNQTKRKSKQIVGSSKKTGRKSLPEKHGSKDTITKLKKVKIHLIPLTLQSIEDMGYEAIYIPNGKGMNESEEHNQPKTFATPDGLPGHDPEGQISSSPMSRNVTCETDINKGSPEVQMCENSHFDSPPRTDENLQHGHDTIEQQPSEDCRKPSKKKPHRPCLFCGKLQSKLTLHLRRKHAEEDRVKNALSLPKALQQRAFDKIRKDGIFKANQMLMADKSLTEEKRKEQYYRERRQGQKNILICSLCKGFYDSSSIYKHKTRCSEAESTTTPPVSLSLSMVEEYEESDSFKLQILSKFREDVVGKLCRQDPFIKLIGRQNFKRVLIRKEKAAEIKEKIMSDMRRFGTLFLEFKSIAAKHKDEISSSADMLLRSNFKYLQDAIENVTKSEDGTVKSGLKTGIGYLLKRAAKVLKGHYLLNRDDAKASEVDNFSTLLSYFWPSMFSDAEYANVKARQLDLRRPKRLPNELQVHNLRSHVVKGIAELLDPYRMISKHDYRTLRDLLVCRLTLFNARRGGEPSRLLLKEWEDAEKEEWISHTAVESIVDPLEKQLIGKFKIAYQCGKNLSRIVPLLIPNDCTEGLRKLADEDIRSSVGIDPRNEFLFPNMQSSSEHIKGWHAVQSVCSDAGIPNMITATSMRHRAATIYASLDVPENERKAFYSHMGHSEEINKNVYQCPLAIQEMTKVGRFLDDIDTQIVPDKATLENECNLPVATTSPSQQSECSRPGELILTTCTDQQAKTAYSRSSKHGKTATVTTSSKISTFRSGRKVLKMQTAKNRSSEAESNSDSEDPEISFREANVNVSRMEETAKAVVEPSIFRPSRNVRKLSVPMDFLPEDEDMDDDKDSDYTDSFIDESSDDYEEEKTVSPNCRQTSTSESVQCVKGARLRWSAESTRKILDYFPTIVSDTSSYDRKGPLPGKAEVLKLLQKHPELFDQEKIEISKQVLLVRTKLFNERNKARRLMQNQLNELLR